MMGKMNRVKYAFLALAILCGSTARAQKAFKYGAGLEKIPASGFYKIALSPEVLSRTRPDLADVRIVDEDDRQVPYIFGSSLPAVNHVFLLPLFEGPSEPDSVSSYIVGNKEGYSLNQLVLQLRNTDVKRTLNLSGSDDSKKWYAIKDNMPLEPSASAGKNGTYEQLLNFPFSTYRYFRIDINGNHKLPVEIASIKLFEWRSIQPSYTQLPAAIITQRDSDKVSYVTLKFKNLYQINKLLLHLSGAKFYNREVSIFDGKRTPIFNGTINSSKPAELQLSVKTDKIYLEIRNHDNPPLTLTGVDAWQLDQTLISYLEAGKKYRLLFGDLNATAPDYDLAFFTDSVANQSVRAVNLSGFIANTAYREKPAGNSMPSWVLWVAIGAAAIILLTLTLKMTREVNKRAKE
jgi:hypothetical protein